MNIIHPAKTQTVTDYDFKFIGGVPLGITLDTDAGDTVSWSPDGKTVTFDIMPRLLSKQAHLNSPARRLTVCLQHVLAYETRTREIVALTPEQQAEVDSFWLQAAPIPSR